MLHIDSLSRIPIYEQITCEIETFILTGVLKAGEQIPSVRRLSESESINPRTILKAYSDLDARGIITAVPGKGYFISADAVRLLSEGKREKLKTFLALAEELSTAGIGREELDALLDRAYEAKQQARAESD